MQRDNKYRGKRLDNGEWVEGSLLQDDYGVCMIVEFVDHHEQWHEVDPATVGQYTGLKDKDGKEIYEGDIIERIADDNNPIRYIVGYDNKQGSYRRFFFMGGGTISDPWDNGLLLQEYIHKLGEYIAGNIHDNPELLTI